jgi:hypothetical protein
MQYKNRKLTPEHTVRILKKHGTVITIKEAEVMLDFLYKFAKLTLDSFLNQTNDAGSRVAKVSENNVEPK